VVAERNTASNELKNPEKQLRTWTSRVNREAGQ